MWIIGHFHLHFRENSANLHSMTSSAPLGRRERSKRATADHLTAVTRRLTAERGLSGFTIDEVCDAVGVSRRTFFNYFPSKEAAALGVDPEEETQRFADEFLARESDGWAKVIDDFVALIIEHFETAGIDASGHASLVAAIEREPRLLLRFIGMTRERDRQSVSLIASREGVAPNDLRAEAAVAVISTLTRSAAERYLDPANAREFAPILREQLSALRAVLGASSPRKANQ
ncbi:TetR family transcriptional regulator [Agromyces albus]|uniref:TetR family transcriptional regulator n=1 Tax=Agromyces albus TaxID=205332 RepID=A0A4Q2KZQ1_9MICO|nr:TetR family transcriptional regulator [Agromyces albus]